MQRRYWHGSYWSRSLEERYEICATFTRLLQPRPLRPLKRSLLPSAVCVLAPYGL